ncbi:hypothetical protein [Halorubrum sp. HHNYT27]|uniref:hypothetical protein n=1 Tax=Halorubrum sp. HHNYT27 TaxID=3402275 RepID=UPI003EBEEFEE
MGLDAEVEKIKARGASRESLTDGPEDISGGVKASLSTATGAASTATLYVDTQGALDLKIEFSPDGVNWYEPMVGSPVGYDQADSDVIFIEYDAAAVRVTGSNSTPVDLDLRVTA